ncbi:MAG: hypothetical protein KDB08_03810 [Microthrixaceae bacterium]|nr:hypothetical protein [Microthrixaceae bacterium]
MHARGVGHVLTEEVHAHVQQLDGVEGAAAEVRCGTRVRVRPGGDVARLRAVRRRQPCDDTALGALIDGGSALAPLVLAVASAAGVLGIGVFVTAGCAIPGWLIASRFLPRLTAQASRRTRREAGLPVDSG